MKWVRGWTIDERGGLSSRLLSGDSVPMGDGRDGRLHPGQASELISPDRFTARGLIVLVYPSSHLF